MRTMPNPSLADDFQTKGFCFTDPLYSAESIAKTIQHMDAVIAGDYETGTAPHSRRWNPGDPPEQLCKIDQPHLADRTLYQAITNPALGLAASQILGADFVQVWAVQLLNKPPGGSDLGNIGWHQDMQHWKTYWEGEVFTAWLALGDIVPDSGPMRFVVGSHTWGLNENPSFFFSEKDHETQQREIRRPSESVWVEEAALLSAGGVSFHHRHTFHGSGPNHSAGPRRSLAIHLRTGDSAPLGGNSYYTEHLEDEAFCPVIYRSPAPDRKGNG
ncbi:MAG: phytanoyl-CoA dioxygenase family protein [bacterium]|nr:phytanoyl-CoA dioxygenase family protein [bacterium]